MLRSGAPWWMYIVAVVFILTFLFNMRQEFWGPASGGWIPEPSLFKVGTVLPGGPMDKAGGQAGGGRGVGEGYRLNRAVQRVLVREPYSRGPPMSRRVRGRGPY